MGVTVEIDKGEGWRISRATVSSDGPFSQFPGTDRILTVLPGGSDAAGDTPLGIELNVTPAAGTTATFVHSITSCIGPTWTRPANVYIANLGDSGLEPATASVLPLSPVHFPGDQPTSARLLSSPIEDLNLMVTRSMAPNGMDVTVLMWDDGVLLQVPVPLGCPSGLGTEGGAQTHVAHRVFYVVSHQVEFEFVGADGGSEMIRLDTGEVSNVYRHYPLNLPVLCSPMHGMHVLDLSIRPCVHVTHAARLCV